MGTRFGLEWLVGSTVIPATAMIFTGHPWMAVSTIGAGFIAAVVVVRIGACSARDRHRETLTYASTAVSLGADPAPVIKAMRTQEERTQEDYAGDVVVEEDRGPHLHIPRGRW